MGTVPSSHEVKDFAFSSIPASLEVIYTPDSIRRQGWHVWGTIISEFLNSRELIWRLILRDISVAISSINIRLSVGGPTFNCYSYGFCRVYSVPDNSCS